MTNRHLARSVVLQSLFEVDSGLKNESPNDILMRNVSEFAPSQSVFPFMKGLFDLVLSKWDELNEIIEKAAPEWPLEKIAIVDRNILRIGLTELLFGDARQVPPKVAINEAIELAKEFGSDSSSRFVNGVLGHIYDGLNKGTVNNHNSDTKDAEKKEEEQLTEYLVGAVVYAKDGEDMYVALVHDVFGHWTLPKGKLLEDEKMNNAVVRKVKEELGIQVDVKEQLGENQYEASKPDGTTKIRHATYFLAEAPYEDLTLKKEGGLDDAQWFKMIDIVDLNFYDDVLPIITKAVNILASKR